MTDDSPKPTNKIDSSVPHSARIWNFWLGGKDHYPVDRVAGEEYIRTFPGIVALARGSRYFLLRVVRHLAAEQGVRQFLDVGTGLPTMDNTHEVAQRVAPDSRIVYVDNDPLVLVTANALLTNTTPEGVTSYVDADMHDPGRIVEEARKTLDFSKPVAVMFMGVLGHVEHLDEARSIVSRIMAELPSGSYLVLWDSTNTTEGFDEAQEGYDDTGAVRYILRSPEEVGTFFEGLEVLEPGVVSVSLWRPDNSPFPPTHVDGYGAVARKP